MNKLLSAGFFRMRRDGMFLIGVIVMAALGALMPVARYIDNIRTGGELALESSFFTYAVVAVAVSSVFCSLFLGAEYGGGAIRNKLVAGRSRAAVYGANLIVCCVAGLIMQAAYIFMALAIGLPLLGAGMSAAGFIVLIVCIMLTSAAFTALFTLIAMLVSSRAVSAVVCVLSMVLMLFLGVYIAGMLNEPETYPSYSYTDSTGTQFDKEEPNPYYLRGAKRELFEQLYDILPGGQTVQLAGASAEHPIRLMLYSLALTALITAVGMCCFQRKDIK